MKKSTNNLKMEYEEGLLKTLLQGLMKQQKDLLPKTMLNGYDKLFGECLIANNAKKSEFA